MLWLPYVARTRGASGSAEKFVTGLTQLQTRRSEGISGGLNRRVGALQSHCPQRAVAYGMPVVFSQLAFAVSMPVPPAQRSVAGPPHSLSLPASPYTLSAPPSPLTLSLPRPPRSVLAL